MASPRKIQNQISKISIIEFIATQKFESIHPVQILSPDLPPAESLAATRFTIGDFDVSCVTS